MPLRPRCYRFVVQGIAKKIDTTVLLEQATKIACDRGHVIRLCDAERITRYVNVAHEFVTLRVSQFMR